MPHSQKNSKSASRPLKILFADDEIHLQELIAAEVPRMGHEVTVCSSGTEAVAALENGIFDCLLVDLDMPGMHGIEVIENCKQIAPETEAVVLTGKGSTETAISALRLGAFDYLQKPCKLVDLKALFQRVAAQRDLKRQILALRRRLDRAEGSANMIGEHRSMQRLKALIAKVAPTDSTVLIHGETGTGKELAARSVHESSLRAEQPFVAINCGALPENLIESELFGHCKGAFTGAGENRQGLFEVADGGTLFLDEVGELPKQTQASLLRVLESGEVKRVGESEPFSVDVRIVCATHRDLPKMVADGEFREDLMYRINTFEVKLPALRDRLDDVPELAKHLLIRHRPEAARLADPFDSQAIKQLKNHSWGGNIRELANVIERAAIVNDALPIVADDLPALSSLKIGASADSLAGKSLREVEMETIYATLDQHDGNKTAAARQLGISLKTLYNKLNADITNRAA